MYCCHSSLLVAGGIVGSLDLLILPFEGTTGCVPDVLAELWFESGNSSTLQAVAVEAV